VRRQQAYGILLVDRFLHLNGMDLRTTVNATVELALAVAAVGRSHRAGRSRDCSGFGLVETASKLIGHEFDLGLGVVKQDLTTAVAGMGSGGRHANTYGFFSSRKPAFTAPIVLHVPIALAHTYF